MSQPPGPSDPYQQYPGQGPPPPPPPGGGYPQQPPGGGYPQQGPPSGGFPQQGPPQGAPGGGFGPPPQGPGGMPPQGGFDPYGGPPKKQSPLPWILGGLGGLLLIGGGVFALIFFLGGDDTSSPEGTAEAMASAINDQDADKLLDLMCQDMRKEVEPQKEQMTGDDSSLGQASNVQVENVQENGDTAVATMSAEGEEQDAKFSLKKEDDNWTWCEEGMIGGGGPDDGTVPGDDGAVPAPDGEGGMPAPGSDIPMPEDMPEPPN